MINLNSAQQMQLAVAKSKGKQAPPIYTPH